MSPLSEEKVRRVPYQDLHLLLDFDEQVVRLDTQRLTLTRKEFELLSLLVLNAGEVVHRGDLLLWVWGYGPAIRTRTLDVHIRRLRRKLAGYAASYIETVFGIGYRFQPFRLRVLPSLASPPLAIGA